MRGLRVLAAAVLAAVVVVGCRYPTHWAKPSGSSSATQVPVCVQNDVVGYQGPYVAHATTVLNSHPRVSAVLRDVCPTTSRRIIVRTRAVPLPNWGLTTIGWLANLHMTAAWVDLDPKIGRDGSVEQSKLFARHEIGCHGMGGGYVNEAQHLRCNSWAQTYQDLTETYSHAS